VALPEPIIDRDPGDENDYRETVYEGGSMCVYCKEDAALPNDDLCEHCAAEVTGEWLLSLMEAA
jgi:hypothetical protein